MATGVSMFIAKGISESQADKLRELSRFSVGVPFYLGSYLDPAFRLDLYPVRNPEIVELAGAIVARALERGYE
jgi:hypothetical protein